MSEKHDDHHGHHHHHHSHEGRPPKSPYPFWFMTLGGALMILVLLVWLLSQ